MGSIIRAKCGGEVPIEQEGDRLKRRDIFPLAQLFDSIEGRHGPVRTPLPKCGASGIHPIGPFRFDREEQRQIGLATPALRPALV